MEDELTFPKLMDGLSAPVATTTAEGRVDLANRQLLEYLGVSLHDLREWMTSGIVHPDDLNVTATEWERSVQRGEPYEAEQRVRRADGVYRWVHVQATPFRDPEGHLSRWCLLLTDIDERKRAEAVPDGERRLLQMVASGRPLPEVLHAMCTLVEELVPRSACSVLLTEADGTFRLGAGPTLPPGYGDAVSGVPVAPASGPCGTAASSRQRVIVPDLGADPRWIGLGWRTLVVNRGLRSVCSSPILSSTGKVLGTFAIYHQEPEAPGALLGDLISRFTHVASIAVERANHDRELKRAEEVLRAREHESRTIVDTIPGMVGIITTSGVSEFLNRQLLEYFGRTLDEFNDWKRRDFIHPDDFERVSQLVAHALATEIPANYEARFRRSDGVYRWFQVRWLPERDGSGRLSRWFFLITDIEDLKQAQDALRSSKRTLQLVVDTIPALAWSARPDGSADFFNQHYLEYTGLSSEQAVGWGWTTAVHPDDLEPLAATWGRIVATGTAGEAEARLRKHDGSYRCFLFRTNPLRDESGAIIKWHGVNTDIEDLKTAAKALQANERNLNLILDTIPAHIYILNIEGQVQYVNRAVIEYTGLTLRDVQQEDYRDRVIHPEDFERVRARRAASLRGITPFSTEQRVLGKDGQYRWFLVRYNPLLDEEGVIVRWYVVAFDIEDRKRAEAELGALRDQLHRENLVLRDEVDRTSMFEEIVGVSPALKSVLARLEKVAGTDSTVLITGETGTGKELVARAIHRRSAREGRPFVSVNCAAVPRDLIASELFGHEKGAFTGAIQKRLGRFELAQGGTLFLDEVGDLPMETQVALLRVLQEREVTRVGGSTSIRIDVRVIAATNRNLQETTEGGTFRRDLYYRLNVFPITVPPLRERADDVSLLVEYFIDRYARKTGKNIQRVNRRSLEHLQSYPWPGNVRELQNVIERSVILSDSDEFTVDESWLSTTPATSSSALPNSVASHERAMIEDALRASGGRVFGPLGAAARLGIARSTLESKIRGLGIDKNRFRARPRVK